MSLKTHPLSFFSSNPLHSFSLRTRLVLIFVLIFGSTTLMFSIFLYYFLNKSLLHDFDDALFNYSVDVEQVVELMNPSAVDSSSPLRVEEGKIFPFPSGTALIMVRDLEGHRLIQAGHFGQFRPDYLKALDALLKGADSYYQTIEDSSLIPDAEAQNYRLITYPMTLRDGAKYLLQIAVPMGTFETQLDQLKLILYFGLPAVLVIAIVSGLFVTSRALRPVQEIIDKAHQIDAFQLNERVPTPKSKDEIQKLAETINQMLSRIENAFASQERFVADASHQLLTPLTIMKGEFELQEKVETSVETKRFIRSGLQEIDHLTKIVKDMLLLSQIDSGAATLHLSSVFLDEIVLEVVSNLQALADLKKIHLRYRIEEQAERHHVRGASDLLYSLFFNLVENALKYSPSLSTVNLTITWRAEDTVFTVEDQGPGIPVANRPFIFQRFSRGDTSSKAKKGYGLGLAIAQKIAYLHQTEIQLLDKTTPGCLFSLKIKNI